MTYTDMTKTALNDLLPENLRCTASQLNKTSKAELIDMLERRDATQAEAKALAKHPAQDAADLTDKEKHVVVAMLEAGIDCNGAETLDAMLSDNMTYCDVKEAAQRTGLTQKTVKGVLGSLTKRGLIGTEDKPNGEPGVDQFLGNEGIRVAFELLAMGVEAMRSVDDKIRDAKIVKMPAPKTGKARLADRVLVEPTTDLSNVRPIREGTKRHAMVKALLKGCTLDELAEATGWSRNVASAAVYTDLKA